MTSLIRVLLIEDDPEHVALIKSHVSRKHGASVEIHWASRLSVGLERLEQGGVDVILLDLGLPDSSIKNTLNTVLSKSQDIPIVVLSSLEDEEFGTEAIHEGAQDYICKSWMDGELLFRSLRYAIERKNIEEELRRANRTKDEFLATLSHELRTPIGVIQGFAELLAEGPQTEEERKQAIDAILRNSKLQVSLINDLLDMSRIVTGKFSLQNVDLDLVPIVNSAILAVNFAAQSKQIKIETFFDPAIGPLNGDPVRLHQIMWNLLSNAIKFTPSGGRIEVHLNRVGQQVEIHVKDTGEGIDPEFLPYVFDRFRQQDNSIKRQHGGLGLGLAIVKYLVELHGGKVSAKSDGIGKGAIFTVSLPLVALRINSSGSLKNKQCRATGSDCL